MKVAGTKIQTKDFVRSLYGNLTKSYQSVGRLKANADLATINKIIRGLPPYPHPIAKLFFCTPWQSDISGLFKKQLPQFTGSLISEIQWTTATIANFSDELNEFFDNRKKCETAFFLGDFEAAESQRLAIDKKFGISLWSLQQHFLHLEFQFGLESNAKHLSELNSIKDLHFFVSVLINFLSMRAERQMSYENYQYKLKKYLAAYDNHQQLKSFFKHLIGQEEIDLQDEDLVLCLLSNGALIDRCLYLIALLQRLFIIKPTDFELLLPSLEFLCEKLHIDSTRNISVLISEKGLTVDSTSAKVLNAFDKYTEGNYVDAARLSGEMIRELPACIQLFELYVKSLIFNNQPLTSPFADKSPAGEVLMAIDSIYRKSADYSAALESLSRFAKNYHHTPMAIGLHYLINSETNPKAVANWECLTMLDSQFLDPKIYLVARDFPEKEKVMQKFRSAFDKSATIEFLSCYLTNSKLDSEIILPESLGEERKLRYKAVALLMRNDFNGIPLLEELYTRRKNSALAYPLYDEIVFLIFDAYVRAEFLEKAVDIYVDNMLSNPLNIQGLDILTLTARLDNLPSNEISRNIKIPIFYAATQNNPAITYIPYDNYLTANGFRKPTDLLASEPNIDSKLLIYFLNHVCTEDVMCGSYHFTGTETLENERLQILQYLCRIDNSNRAAYAQEIDDITQRIFIRKGIRQSNEGKIHVDTEGIRRAGEKLLRESFRRYQDISSLKGFEGLKLLDTNAVSLYVKEAGAEKSRTLDLKDLKILEAEGVRVIFHSHFTLFKDLFIDIRDRYILSSEYGLDSYLSVRIRHGTLQGQLRSRFELLHLVTQYNNQSGKYQRNAFWDEKLPACTSEQKEAVQSLLARLSKEIDDLTRRVKDEAIQIKTESRNPKGQFDYRFSDVELFRLFTEQFEPITDYDEFMDNVFKVLKSRTEQNLRTVRDYISTTLKEEFVQRISAVQADLRKLQIDSTSTLLAAMTNGLTAIQNECDIIAHWFALVGVTFERFTLREIVNVCLASVNNVSPEVQISPNLQIEDCKIAGTYFHTFFDILRALLDNVVKCSGYIGKAPNVNIFGGIKEEKLILKIANSITEEVRQTDPVKMLAERMALIRTRGISDEIKKEGGSGYFKIAKLLKYDLERQDAEISFDYKNGNQFEVTIIFSGKEILV